ncbi:MAG TPA: SDR family oxidoreductase [Longimicrobiales bacterium]|nr:SDR family oxidoreductase [Longimicrobiales bacterium]
MTESPSLEGRLAIVTGGSRGIGRAVVDALEAAGAHVVTVSRGTVVDDLDTGKRSDAVAADISQEYGVDAIARHLDGRVPDVVVHSAGAFTLASLADTTVQDFDRMLAVNLRAAYLLMHRFLPSMIARGSGHFVSIGSIAGRQALPGNAGYAASKFGLRGLHAVLDLELRGTGVRATLIEPSATATGLWDAVDGADYDLPAKEAMLDPAAVADAVVYAVTRPPQVGIPNLLIGRS